MSPIFRLFLFIILPILAVLSWPPEILADALPLIAVAAVVFVLLGVLLWQGRSLALTLTIFIQGLNVIVRLMMFFSHAKPASGPWDVPYIVAALFSIALSAYLLLRLDQGDIRAQMVT